MAYKYVPDHLKKRAGRPRKEKDINTEVIPRYIPVVQLDYLTGEYIGEYPSMSAAERDNDLAELSIIHRFGRSKSCMVNIRGREMLFMRKAAFENMIKSYKEVTGV